MMRAMSRTTTEDVVNAVMGGTLFLTFGLIFWPITVAMIIVSIPIILIKKQKWWHGPIAFIVWMLLSGAISVAANYPRFGGTGNEEVRTTRFN